MWFRGRMNEIAEDHIEVIRPMTERQISGLEGWLRDEKCLSFL